MTVSHLIFGGLALLGLSLLGWIAYLKLRHRQRAIVSNPLPRYVVTQDGQPYNRSHAVPDAYIRDDDHPQSEYVRWSTLWHRLSDTDRKRWAHLKPS